MNKTKFGREMMKKYLDSSENFRMIVQRLKTNIVECHISEHTHTILTHKLDEMKNEKNKAVPYMPFFVKRKFLKVWGSYLGFVDSIKPETLLETTAVYPPSIEKKDRETAIFYLTKLEKATDPFRLLWV